MPAVPQTIREEYRPGLDISRWALSPTSFRRTVPGLPVVACLQGCERPPAERFGERREDHGTAWDGPMDDWGVPRAGLTGRPIGRTMERPIGRLGRPMRPVGVSWDTIEGHMGPR